MFRYIVVACAALIGAGVQTQTTDYDPELVIHYFGTPPTTKTAQTPNYDLIVDVFGTQPPATTQPLATTQPPVVTTTPVEIAVKPSEACHCVPYYLCDNEGNGLEGTYERFTGFRQLDVRFGQPGDPKPICKETVEVCCKAPKDTLTIVKPKPKPAPSCGYRNPKGLGASFICHGHAAQFGEYPWVVALINNNNGSFVGVGVIIHPQVIMTGAHIASKYGPNGLKIRAGEWDTQTVKEIYDHQERVVQEIYSHSEFDPKNLRNDIALLRLQAPLQIAEHINMLCLPDLNENFDNSKGCISNGWGKDQFGLTGQYAVILKKVSQDMMPLDRCKSLLRRTRLGKYFKLHSSFVCAGGEEGQDTCEGDGGGALACPIGNDRYQLTGLVSWGIGCGQKDVPSVFTNVPAFRTWVDNKMRGWGFGTTSYTI